MARLNRLMLAGLVVGLGLTAGCRKAEQGDYTPSNWDEMVARTYAPVVGEVEVVAERPAALFDEVVVTAEPIEPAIPEVIIRALRPAAADVLAVFRVTDADREYAAKPGPAL